MNLRIAIHLNAQKMVKDDLARLASYFWSSAMVSRVEFEYRGEPMEYLFLYPRQDLKGTRSEIVDELKRLIRRIDPDKKTVEQFEFQEFFAPD